MEKKVEKNEKKEFIREYSMKIVDIYCKILNMYINRFDW